MMNYLINVFSEFNVKTCYIRELNNYFEIDIDTDDGEYLLSEDELKNFIKINAVKEYEKFSKLIDKRAALNNQEVYSEEYWGARYTLCLHISRKCNLACKYCFGSEDHLPQEMTFDKIKEIIDYFIYDYAKNARQYIIDLSGSGEPLFQFELIRRIEEYTDKIRDELGKDIMLMFCTNATLIDEEKAEYFKTKNRILLGVSIDGNQSQNSNRRYKNQKEAYHDIIRGISLLSPKTVGLAVTVTKDNEEVDEIYDFLYQIENCDCISIQNVRDFSDNENSFYRLDFENIFNHYRKLLQNMYEHIKIGDYEYFNKLLRGADTLGNYLTGAFYKGTLFQYRCDGGKKRLVIDDKGDIYTCSVFNGCKEFKIGNIQDGIDKNKRNQFSRRLDSLENNCSKCWCSYICSGECSAVSYYTNGDLYSNNEKYCEYRKNLIRLAVSFMNRVKKELPEQYKEISKYFIETSSFEILDAGIWAVFHVLKMMNISMKYSELVDNLENSTHGVKPAEIIRFMSNSTNKKYTIYRIREESDVEKIVYPAICLLNKNHGNIYQYCIIVRSDSDCFILKIMESTEEIKVQKKVFFSELSEYIICKEDYIL